MTLFQASREDNRAMGELDIDKLRKAVKSEIQVALWRMVNPESPYFENHIKKAEKLWAELSKPAKPRKRK